MDDDAPALDRRLPVEFSPSDDCTLGASADDELLRAVAAAPSPTRLVADLAVGTVVADTYEIVGTLGAGAMGVVYEALDRALGRRVALKLHGARAGADPRRVWREARAMARLADPHVVTIHEVGLHDGRLFIAMELVPGSDARRWVRRATRTATEILGVYRQAALGLAAAHAVGIVHRDFKPDNVLVGDDGRVRVADFGLARTTGGVARDDVDGGDGPAVSEQHTRTGAAAGTPAYMAPELAGGRAADARSDQYAFGVAMYEAFTGERPLPDRDANAELPRRGLPRFVHDALRRSLSPAPEARFEDMPALLRALEPPRRGWRGATAVVAIGAAAAFAIVGTRARPCDDAAFAATAPWDDGHRAAVTAAFEGSGFPDAAEVAARVGDALAAWSTAAVAARRTACEATHVQGDQTEARMQLRVDCIDRMQRRVAALIHSLEGADATAVGRADEAVAQLPELARCEDTETLAQAEPIAQADRADHAALRERIDVLDVEGELGQAVGLDASIAVEVAAAEAADYPDNLAAANLLQGRDAIARHAYEPAIAALGRAIAAGWRARDVDITIEGMRLLARALASSPSRLDDALRWLDSAAALAQVAPPSPTRDARIALTRANALNLAGRGIDAERSVRETLAWLPHGSPLEAEARAILGNALVPQRRNAEAIAEHRRAVELTEQLRGPRHPEVASRVSGLGIALDDAGEYAEGAEQAARALALREAAYGPDSAAVAASLAQVGENQRFRNDIAGELASYERALAITAGLDPPDDALRIRLIGNMIPPLAYSGQLPRARELLLGIMPVAERVYGHDSLRVAELLQMLATTEETADHHREAVEAGLEAARLFERHLGGDNQRTAEAYVALGSAMVDVGRYDEAIAVLQRAASIFESAPEPPPRMLGFVAALSADAYTHVGRDREALAAGATAVQLMGVAYPRGHVDLAETLAFHAERVARAGHRGAARAMLERARAMVDDPAIDPSIRRTIDGQLAKLSRR